MNTNHDAIKAGHKAGFASGQDRGDAQPDQRAGPQHDRRAHNAEQPAWDLKALSDAAAEKVLDRLRGGGYLHQELTAGAVREAQERHARMREANMKMANANDDLRRQLRERNVEIERLRQEAARHQNPFVGLPKTEPAAIQTAAPDCGQMPQGAQCQPEATAPQGMPPRQDAPESAPPSVSAALDAVSDLMDRLFPDARCMVFVRREEVTEVDDDEERTLATVREALRPFARFVQAVDGRYKDDACVGSFHSLDGRVNRLLLGDVRRAADTYAALARPDLDARNGH